MNRTGIEWCDWTWNPIVGCSPVSEGCAKCYAERIARRFGWTWGRAWFNPERLDQPAKVRKPGRVFVCSMADLFHETVTPQWLSVVTEVMREVDWHTFLVLTKRPQNIPDGWDKPDNVWVGITAEDQERLDERLPYLHGMPGTRFVSVEPMLGPVTFSGQHVMPEWVIAGPETGPGARPCDPAWIDALADGSPCFFDKRKTGWTRREWPQEGRPTP